jgi:mannose-6-phosphate isomerase-like protein (cupin superfamily)
MLRPGEGAQGGDASVKAGRASTGGVLTVIESVTRGGAPRHVHERDDECFYVIDGVITVECGDDQWEAGPRSFVYLPRGVPHSWDVVGDEPATVLIITVPAGLEQFLHDFHAVTGSEERNRVASEHGITFL